MPEAAIFDEYSPVYVLALLMKGGIEGWIQKQ